MHPNVRNITFWILKWDKTHKEWQHETQLLSEGHKVVIISFEEHDIISWEVLLHC